jgi:hypothetical protein
MRWGFIVTLAVGVLNTTGFGQVPPAFTQATSDVASNFMQPCFNGTLYVMVGYAGISTSTDARQWTKVVSPAEVPFGVAWNGAVFVAVGLHGSVLISSNGVGWTSQFTGVGSNLFNVTWNGSTFVAVGSNGTIITSPNGITWSVRASHTTMVLPGITSNGTLNVATGDGGTLITSPDAVNWTLQASPTRQNLPTVTWNGSMFLAAGGKIQVGSTDGTNWRITSSGMSGPITGLATGNGKFMGVGPGMNSTGFEPRGLAGEPICHCRRPNHPDFQRNYVNVCRSGQRTRANATPAVFAFSSPSVVCLNQRRVLCLWTTEG